MHKSLKWLGSVALSSLFMAHAAVAQWELDNSKSEINFMSIKNRAVGETHGFGSMVGYINPDGHAKLAIDLDSVDTLIPIRDERMRSALFETGDFPTASISALIEPAILEAVADGGVINTDITFTLALHGIEQKLTAPVTVIGEPGGRLTVLTTRPLIVSAAAFGLDAGIEVLRTMASLTTINLAVPVTVHLVFDYSKPS